MKILRLSIIISVLLVTSFFLAGGQVIIQAQELTQYISAGGGAGPMSSGFTYQGQLKDSGAPVNGTCDFIFSLWDQSTEGTQIGGNDIQPGIQVNNGLFTTVINFIGQFDSGGTPAFKGDLRYLEINVRCPAGTGQYTTLSPRQLNWAVPYALTLAPTSTGSRIYGDAYQVLKVTNNTTLTGNPAGVTGEISNSLDGVGVYGGYHATTTGSRGMGVWGRSYALAGAGVKGTAYNGSTGVYAESNSRGINSPALYAENSDTTTSTPAGIAIYGLNHSADATIVARNTGTGDVYRAINAAGNAITFRVDNSGHVFAPAGDLAEHFAVSGATPEPGTVMVLDEEHPGQLKPSSTSYDPKVAGVVSGAGGLQPGLTLAEENGVPIAIGGRVYVNAEAQSNPIQIGDLLTSSNLPGYAMKAAERSLALGAVIGKAMSNLESGTGLVLVLINLQ